MDTFSFAYKIKRNEDDAPIEDNISMLYENDRIERLRKKQRMKKIQKKPLSIGSLMKLESKYSSLQNWINGTFYFVGMFKMETHS